MNDQQSAGVVAVSLSESRDESCMDKSVAAERRTNNMRI